LRRLPFKSPLFLNEGRTHPPPQTVLTFQLVILLRNIDRPLPRPRRQGLARRPFWEGQPRLSLSPSQKFFSAGCSFRMIFFGSPLLCPLEMACARISPLFFFFTFRRLLIISRESYEIPLRFLISPASFGGFIPSPPAHFFSFDTDNRTNPRRSYTSFP